jgi:hypothetical protein
VTVTHRHERKHMWGEQQVAQSLFLAPTIVQLHLEKIFAELDTPTGTAAAPKAFPLGLGR